MFRAKTTWVSQAGSGKQLFQCLQGILMILKYAFCLVRHDQRPHASGVLRGHTRRAMSGMTSLGLQATK